ncbi:MAG: NAD(P)/FAD-dependent oxidoreductase, partial [bacterium]
MMYDLLVIGAGPAGLSAAYTAAKSGIKVAVLEKSKEIGYPIHTSGGSWIDELKQLDIPERFMNPIREGLFISPGEKTEFRYSVPPGCILDVRGLYQYLAELASAEGAEIFVNTAVIAPRFEAKKISGVS